MRNFCIPSGLNTKLLSEQSHAGTARKCTPQKPTVDTIPVQSTPVKVLLGTFAPEEVRQGQKVIG